VITVLWCHQINVDGQRSTEIHSLLWAKNWHLLLWLSSAVLSAPRCESSRRGTSCSVFNSVFLTRLFLPADTI